MRLHHIRLKNLNALMGEWEIDLTHPAMVNDGIFAIVGPTGSGKTTLLDAICLALYGRTPRLSKLSKSGNDIMSRPAGDCFAEVEFSTQKGTYRCHWSQHRARRKAEGEWQPPKHEIACAITGQLLDTTLKGVPEHVARVTGMDFDRFTRSMLLAQGGFDAFLKADIDQRAPILEQITGSELYSHLSIRVHEQLQLEKQALQTCQDETRHIPVLSSEAEAALEQDLVTHQTAQRHAQDQLTQARQALAWHDTLCQLDQQAAQLDQQAAQLTADRHAFAPDHDVWLRAEAAHQLVPAHEAWQTACAQYRDLQMDLDTETQTLARATHERDTRQQALTTAQDTMSQYQAQWDERESLWQTVSQLDTQLALLATTIDAHQEALKQAEQERAATQNRLEGHRLAIQAVDQQLDTLAQWREDRPEDQALVADWPRLQDQRGWWESLQQTMKRRGEQWLEAVQAVTNAQDTVSQCQAKRNQCQQDWERLQGSHQAAIQSQQALLGDRDLSSYQDEKTQREAAHQQALVQGAWQAHRDRLEPDTPCPLCGSTTHPWGTGLAVPNPDDGTLATITDIIARAEEWARTIRTYDTQLQEARTQWQDAQHQHELARVQYEAAERHRDTVAADLQRDRQSVAEWWSGTTWWQGDPPDTAEAMALVWQQLASRVAQWQHNLATGSRLTEERDRHQMVYQQDLATETAQTQALSSRQSELTALCSEHQRIRQERVAGYGDHRVDDEKDRIRQAIDQARTIVQETQAQWQAATQRVDISTGRREGLVTQCQERAMACEALGGEWRRECEAAGFADEATWLAARRPPEVRAALTHQATVLHERGVILASDTKACKSRLAHEREKAVTELSRDACVAACDEWVARVHVHSTQVVLVSQQLRDNESAKVKQAESQQRMEAQKKDYDRWAQLHGLIGSADGKKYRLFAQGITFDGLISHANHHLRAMTDRYLLIRDETTPLALNVVDHYQAGSIRSTKNLSGGESFMVSLALALGLSHMASRNVRVDSLFLDEGFGTLDDEALHTAIDMLSGLYQGGKMMGVISHVPALKERIRTQIQVIPMANGQSRLSGPGVVNRSQSGA